MQAKKKEQNKRKKERKKERMEGEISDAFCCIRPIHEMLVITTTSD